VDRRVFVSGVTQQLYPGRERDNMRVRQRRVKPPRKQSFSLVIFVVDFSAATEHGLVFKFRLPLDFRPAAMKFAFSQGRWARRYRLTQRACAVSAGREAI